MQRSYQMPEYHFQPSQQQYQNYNWPPAAQLHEPPPPAPPRFFNNKPTTRNHAVQFQHQQPAGMPPLQHSHHYHRQPTAFPQVPSHVQVVPQQQHTLAGTANQTNFLEKLSKLQNELAAKEKLIEQMQAEKEKMQKACEELMDGLTKQLEENEKLEDQLNQSRVPKKELVDVFTETKADGNDDVDMVDEDDEEEDCEVNAETIKQKYAANLRREREAQALSGEMQRELAECRDQLSNAAEENAILKNELKYKQGLIRRLQQSFDIMKAERDDMYRKYRGAKRELNATSKQK